MGEELALRSVGEDVVKQGNLALLKKLKLWVIYYLTHCFGQWHIKGKIP